MAGFVIGYRDRNAQPVVEAKFGSAKEGEFVRVRALIDTGADTNHLRSDLVERLKAPLIRSVRHFGHGPETYDGTLHHVRCRLTGTLDDHSSGVHTWVTEALSHTPRADAPYDAVIGWPVLETMDLQFLRDGTFILRWFDRADQIG